VPQRLETFDSSGLAGAVWTEKTEDLPLGDIKGYIRDGDELAIGLAEIMDGEYGRHNGLL
jgi:hypothetical protein